MASSQNPSAKKKRNTTRLHNRAERIIPFFAAEPLINKHLPGKMKTRNVGLYYTVAAEEVIIELLETAASFVQNTGINKKGGRKGRIKAEHIAKALNKKGTSLHGVLPSNVSGEFIANEELSRFLDSSTVDDVANAPANDGLVKKKKKVPKRKRVEEKETEPEPEQGEYEEDSFCVADDADVDEEGGVSSIEGGVSSIEGDDDDDDNSSEREG